MTKPTSPEKSGAGWLLALPPAALTLFFVALVPRVSGGETIRFAWQWAPSLGIELSFAVDGLGLTFALLISGIGFFVALYSSTYLAGHPAFGRFALFLLLFMAAMLGLVLASDLIALFVFWELTTITSFFLIGFDHAAAKARRSALQALLLTGAGGLALLAGLLLLGQAAGGFDFADVLTGGEQIRAHALYLPALVLILIGAFTKSAQFPFHFWLPNAMAAPTPVSAYLHSATMVKAGIYLLARLHPALSGTEVWIWTLTIVGAVTALLSSLLAVRQKDLKLVLAYTTVMALGTLTMFLGSGATVAVAAAVTFLIVHSLYKAALFLVVGIIDHATGSRDPTLLRGLGRAMPITTVAAAAAGLSMAGFPPFLGFIGKELKYEGALAVASEPVLVAGAAVLANALMVAAAGIVAWRPFRGEIAATPRPAHEAPITMWLGPISLATLGLLFGIFPGLIAKTLVQPGVTAILGRPEKVKLALWHGINVPLMLSLLTFALGLALYFMHAKLRGALAAIERSVPIDFDRGWDRLLDGLKALASAQTRWLQHGVLRRYLAVVFATLAIGLGATWWQLGGPPAPDAWPDLPIKQWAVVALIAAGAVMAALASSRLGAIGALGAVGVGVALLFVLFGAPDVAITQLMVETLVVVLVTVVMLRLPGLGRFDAPRNRAVNAVIAIAVGAVVSLTLLAVVDGPIDRSVSDFFEAESVPSAYGRNIVNVILVDFRALDTFGEIAVIAVAALGALALIRGRPGGAARAGRERIAQSLPESGGTP